MTILGRFIRNDAVANDPPEIYNRRALLVSLAVCPADPLATLLINPLIRYKACGGALLFGMDMGTIGGVLTMESFQKYVNP